MLTKYCKIFYSYNSTHITFIFLFYAC